MKRRLKSRAGFTLAEVLIVIVIMSLITAAGATVTGTLLGERLGMIRAADAEILGSDVLQALANELRFGKNIEVGTDNASVTLDSATYGIGAELSLKDGKLVAEQGKIRVLNDSSYNGLIITDLALTRTDGQVEIHVAIGDERHDSLWDGGFTVSLLNDQ